MHPILFEVGRLHVVGRSYQTLMVLGVLAGLWTTARWAERYEKIDHRKVLCASLLLAAVAFAGARLHFVVNQWAGFASRPLAAFPVWEGGLHAPGGIIAFACAAPLVVRWFGIPWRRFVDASVPGAGVALGIVRLGCFLNGCCFGTLCAWPWGVRFPRSSLVFLMHADQGLVPPDALQSAPVHPLQLYFAAAGLLLVGCAWWVTPRKRYDGQVALIGLLAFSATSAVLEVFRADYAERTYWGPLPQLEWTTLAMTLAVGTMVVLLGLRHRRSRIAAAPTPAMPPPSGRQHVPA